MKNIEYSSMAKMAASAIADNGIRILNRPIFASRIAKTVNDGAFIYYLDKLGKCIAEFAALPYGNDYPVIGEHLVTSTTLR